MDPQSQTPQAQPVQVQQQLTPPTKKAPSKMLVLILGVVIVLLVIGAYVLGTQKNASQKMQAAITPTVAQPTPTSDPMVGWKTYSSKDNEFSIQYPPDVTVRQNTPANNKYGLGKVITLDIKEKKCEVCSIFVNIITTDIPPNTLLNQAVTHLYGKSYLDQYFFKQVTIDGIQGLFSKNIPAQYYGEQAFVVKDNKLYEFYLYVYADRPERYSSLFNQILSTFTFTDEEEAVTSSNDTKVRTIVYKKTAGLADYASNTGYSIQIPTGYHSIAGEPEKMSGNVCAVLFTNDAGGIAGVTIVPYNGGSRRVLLPEEASYTYTYEDVLLQGIKSLIQQKGPTGESGSGTNVIIPVGKYALIVGMANRGKDDVQLVSLLQSITVTNPLDISKCGK